MNQKKSISLAPKVRMLTGKKRVVELPEDLTGRELKRWIKKKKIPLLSRKMKRSNPEGDCIRAGIMKATKKLTLVRRYPKDDPPMQRTKFYLK